MTIIEYILHIDNEVIASIESDFYNDFNFLIDKEITRQSPISIRTVVIPSEEFSIKKNEDPERRHEFEYWKKMNVIWSYSFQYSLDIEVKEIQFEFWAAGYINISSNYYKPVIFDPHKYHLKKHQELKLRNFKQLEIQSLRNYKSEYILDDFIKKFHQVCKSTEPIKKFKITYFSNDILFLSQELCYILSELSLYKPYLQNFLSDVITNNNITKYRYFPTFYDTQYFHLASNFLQTIYNFWDRIGDLIYYYFEFSKINSERDVYFDRIINQFPEQYKNEFFDYLFQFCKNEFNEFNNNRKQIVHYNGIESNIFMNWISNINDKQEIEKLQNWKMNLIDEYLNLLDKSFKGIENAMKLIESKNNCG